MIPEVLYSKVVCCDQHLEVRDGKMENNGEEWRKVEEDLTAKADGDCGVML